MGFVVRDYSSPNSIKDIIMPVVNNEVKNTNRMMYITELTNDRLIGWYEQIEGIFNIKGTGECFFEIDGEMVTFTIKYVENDKKFISQFKTYIQTIFENEYDWIFNIWSEQSTGMITEEVK